MFDSKKTSWQGVSAWYDGIVGEGGHYYHQHVVLPGVVRLLDLQPTDSLVDFGCGQGVLSRVIPRVERYLGIDVASGLIAAARKERPQPWVSFQVLDATKNLHAPDQLFTHTAIVLALQNMAQPAAAIANAATFLLPGGKLVVVLNHPAFRIPRQSGWGVEPKTKQQYRWVNRYITPMKIPITMNPGKSASPVTWSFHNPLQEYVQMFRQAGFVITNLEEWVSDKTSEGAAAKMENRARKEFPLFLALVGEKHV